MKDLGCTLLLLLLVYGKIVFQETCPQCQKGWGLLQQSTEGKDVEGHSTTCQAQGGPQWGSYTEPLLIGSNQCVVNCPV